MNDNIKQKNRISCILYAQKNYPIWPLPYSTWHTSVCHYGYSWNQCQDSQWQLVHDDNKDIVTKDDYSSYTPDKITPQKIWVKFNENGTVKETSTEEKVEKEWAEFILSPSDVNND
jgi:hypothetical protein